MRGEGGLAGAFKRAGVCRHSAWDPVVDQPCRHLSASDDWTLFPSWTRESTCRDHPGVSERAFLMSGTQWRGSA